MNGQDIDFKVVPGGFGKRTRKGNCEPGFIIAVVKGQYKGNRCVGEKTVGHYYNDGDNNPTQEGDRPFFTRGAARRAISQLKKGRKAAKT